MVQADYFGVGSVEYLTQCWMRGQDFRSVLSDSKDFLGVADTPDEVFTPMVLGDLYFMAPRPPWLRGLLHSLRKLVASGEVIHFFRDKQRLPADSDCTALLYSLAAKAGCVSPGSLSAVAQRVAQNTTECGVIQVYFDPGGPRDGLVDRVVCVNALYLLNQTAHAQDALSTERFVQQQLEREAFLEGSRYYPSPDTFLYFLSRLVASFPQRYATWTPTLIRQIRNRQGLESRPLELSQRILAATRLGMNPCLDAWLLRQSRLVDASFPADALFRYGHNRGYFGGTTITTAFAARALLEYGRMLRFAGGSRQPTPSRASLAARRAS